MFKKLVNEEKERARNTYGGFRSMHEIFGVLYEEVMEYFDEVRKKPEERNNEEVLSELVQIAAVAEIAAEDMELVDMTTEDVATTELFLLKTAVIKFLGSLDHGKITNLQPQQRGCIVNSITYNEDALQKLKELVDA